MPVFVYEGRGGDGHLRRDVVEAENLRQAVQALREQNVTVINIRERTTSLASADLAQLLQKAAGRDPLAATRMISVALMLAVLVEGLLAHYALTVPSDD